MHVQLQLDSEQQHSVVTNLLSVSVDFLGNSIAIKERFYIGNFTIKHTFKILKNITISFIVPDVV